MKDTFQREITYLRISLTDLCNLRCVYCMPPEGVRKQTHDQILSLEEIGEIARAAVELGVKKSASPAANRWSDGAFYPCAGSCGASPVCRS